MSTDLADALAVDRAIRRRAALEVMTFPGGQAVRHRELHDVHFLNAVLVNAGGTPLPAAGVVAAGERWLGDLGHRHVVFDDADAGERAAAQLTGGGWERTRTAFMVFAGDPADVVADPRAR
ncbi:MAG: hypothetical protein ACXVUX_22780, partial [Solirubrobacteraceae bacterium]